MRKITCARCGGLEPKAGSFAFRGAEYCGRCADELLRAEDDISQEEFARLEDATVCSFCGADAGEAEFGRLARVPCCPACERRMLKGPLPTWVKGFLAAVAAVVVACAVFNLPFYRAFIDMKVAGKAMNAGNIALASSRMSAAASQLPTDSDLRSLAGLYSGYLAMSKGDLRGALEGLRGYLAIHPDDATVSTQAKDIEGGLAFDGGDYRTFYRIQAELSASAPNDPMRTLSLASADACLWAAYGDSAKRDEAETLTAQALAASTAPEAKTQAEEYAKRINYRIKTREIIDKDQYYARHPEEASK